MPSGNEQEFKGFIGLSAHESQPWWPQPVRAKAGSPNVLYLVLDDVGFAQLGCYGGLGGIIETPNIDRLAGGGLRYSDFHTTALCSPTRSCLLTGRNHHSNAMAGITEIATGFPGYNGKIPRRNGFVSQMLVPEGFAAYAIGKWHLTPDEETNMAATRVNWPLGRGFERYYGFLGGETNQWYPSLVEDNHETTPPKTPEQGYHLTEDLTDHAITFIQDLKNVAPDKPFMMYFCPGACHAPHQVPREWADRYKGKFDQGWDKTREQCLQRQLELGIVPPGTELSPRPDRVEAWDSLSTNEKRLYSRMMEVFAGFLTHVDHHIGRLLGFLEETGQIDNTLIFLVSDNGASAEGGASGSVNENLFFNAIPDNLEENLKMLDDLGGPETYNHYPRGWTMAGNTPNKLWKRYTWQGGITDPMIVHWPKGIQARGEIRRQYCHATDLVPTILEVLHLEPPAAIDGIDQAPIEGVSFAHSFNNASAPTNKHVQYYEMFGNRAIWHDGWKAVTDHRPESGGKFEQDVWSLYHVSEDFSECHDLAEKYPEKLARLKAYWWSEAGRYNVLPLDDRQQSRLLASEDRPQLTAERSSYVYYAGGAPVAESVAVNVRNRPYTITADVEIPQRGAEGVLLSEGSRFGGHSFYLKNGFLYYTYNFLGKEEYTVKSTEKVPVGRNRLRMEFGKTGEFQGNAALYFNDRKVAEGALPHTVPITFGLCEGLTCGYSAGYSVTEAYNSPFTFTGKIHNVTVDVSGQKHRDIEAQTNIAFEAA